MKSVLRLFIAASILLNYEYCFSNISTNFRPIYNSIKLAFKYLTPLDLELFECKDASKEMQDYINQIKEKLGIKRLVKVKQLTPNLIKEKGEWNAISIGLYPLLYDYIFVNESSFMKLDKEQKDFVIGHELTHLKNMDFQKKSLPILFLYYCYIYYHYRTYNSLFSIQPSLQMFQLQAVRLIVNQLHNAIIRSCEYNADTSAVTALNCYEGAKSLLFFFSQISGSRPILPIWSHPSEDSRMQNIDNLELRDIEYIAKIDSDEIPTVIVDLYVATNRSLRIEGEFDGKYNIAVTSDGNKTQGKYLKNLSDLVYTELQDFDAQRYFRLFEVKVIKQKAKSTQLLKAVRMHNKFKLANLHKLLVFNHNYKGPSIIKFIANH